MVNLRVDIIHLILLGWLNLRRVKWTGHVTWLECGGQKTRNE